MSRFLGRRGLEIDLLNDGGNSHSNSYCIALTVLITGPAAGGLSSGQMWRRLGVDPPKSDVSIGGSYALQVSIYTTVTWYLTLSSPQTGMGTPRAISCNTGGVENFLSGYHKAAAAGDGKVALINDPTNDL